MILGTISSYSSGSGVTLTIDGETSPTTKKYMFLGSYSPKVGDRVLIAEVGESYVVLDKVVSRPAVVETAQTAEIARRVANRVSGADDGDVIFGISDGRLYYGLKKGDASTTMYKVANA